MKFNGWVQSTGADALPSCLNDPKAVLFNDSMRNKKKTAVIAVFHSLRSRSLMF